jgi:hypothetical protein
LLRIWSSPGCAAAGAVVIGTDLSAAREAFVAVIVAVVGLALITGPWWIRLVSGSVRSSRAHPLQERAELAAHLHDSVLQTLALIQRNSDSPREVARLARGQERNCARCCTGRARPADSSPTP